MPIKIVQASDDFFLLGESSRFQLLISCAAALSWYNADSRHLPEQDAAIYASFVEAGNVETLTQAIDKLLKRRFIARCELPWSDRRRRLLLRVGTTR